MIDYNPKPGEILKTMPKEKWMRGVWSQNGKYCVSGYIVEKLFGSVNEDTIMKFSNMISERLPSEPVPMTHLFTINDEAFTFEHARDGAIAFLERIGLA